MKTPTLIRNYPAHVYHARPEISKHDLDLIRHAPGLYRHAKDNPEESESAALIFGSLYHTAVLEPGMLLDEYFIMPDFDARTKEGKRIRDEAREEAGNRRCVKLDEVQTVQAMHKALLQNPLVAELLKDSSRFAVEPSFFWTDETTGVECRARADLITKDGFIVDLKTCVNADLERFTKDAFKFGYHRQAAHYLRGWGQMLKTAQPDTLNDVPGMRAFVFIAQEKEPPYLSAVYVASPGMLKLGNYENHLALKTASECMASGKWPGIQKRVQEMDLPGWVRIPEAAELIK